MTSQTRNRIAMPLLFVGALALSAGFAAAGGDAAIGQKLFKKNCVVCHKADASGGIKLGSETSADLEAPGLEKTYHNNDEMIVNAILYGKDEEGEDLAKVMPRWAKRGMTKAQAYDIVAYLHTKKSTD